jgi:hypothetical protein
MPDDRPNLSPLAPVLTCLPAPGHFFLRPQLLTCLLKGEALTTALGTDRPLVFAPQRGAAECWFIGPKSIPLSKCQGTFA